MLLLTFWKTIYRTSGAETIDTGGVFTKILLLPEQDKSRKMGQLLKN